MELSKNIEGKVIAITGASSGIGEATAFHLASKGAIVVIAARRVQKLQSIVEKITSEGGKSLYLKVDVTKQKEVEALIQLAADQYGKLDAIINNAGLMALAPLSELKIEEWERMIDINRGIVWHSCRFSNLSKTRFWSFYQYIFCSRFKGF